MHPHGWLRTCIRLAYCHRFGSQDNHSTYQKPLILNHCTIRTTSTRPWLWSAGLMVDSLALCDHQLRVHPKTLPSFLVFCVYLRWSASGTMRTVCVSHHSFYSGLVSRCCVSIHSQGITSEKKSHPHHSVSTSFPVANFRRRCVDPVLRWYW